MVLLSLVQILPQAAAQAPTAPPAPAGIPADPTAASPVSAFEQAVVPEHRLALDFQQANAAEVAEYLSAKSTEPVSILFIGGSENTRLPSMKLRNVTLEEFVLILNQLGSIEAEQGGAGYQLKPIHGVTGVYTFQNINPDAANRPANSGVSQESVFYDLTSILDGKLTVADVTTALNTAWTSTGEGLPSRDSLKFHEESNLLIVTGTPSQLSSSATLIKLLQDRKQASLRTKASAEMMELKNMLDATRDARDRLEFQINDLRQQSSTQLAKSNERVFELEIELARLKATAAKP